MSFDSFTVFGLIAVGLVALVAIQLTLAARHDQVVANAGPQEQLSALQARIVAREATLADIDTKLAERNTALENFARTQAEADALARQLDELRAEYAALGDRREEVRRMDHETQEAVERQAEARRALSEAEEMLAGVRGEFEEARRLTGELDRLRREHEELGVALARLREERRDLDALAQRAEELRLAMADREGRLARLDGEIAAVEERHGRAAAVAADAETRLAAVKDELDEHRAEAKALAREVAELDDRRSRLEATCARLSADAEALGKGLGQAGRNGGETGKEGNSDDLAMLREAPEFLKTLAAMAPRGRERESEALHRVHKHLGELGLSYPPRTLHAFHTAMKVGDTTQLTVLAGISGTGKSQLPRRWASAMGIGFLAVPVQPRWDSPQDLMGFYNYVEQRYRPTELARALFQLDPYNGRASEAGLDDRMMLVLLDEMNLARVEYYFSDFLSRLESRPRRDLVGDACARRDAELELEIPRADGAPPPRLFPGYNVLFAGTMNEDESTQTLSDKVVDRANVLRFSAPASIATTSTGEAATDGEAMSRTAWQDWLRDARDLPQGERDRLQENVDTLAGFMRALDRPVGHRLGRAVMAYVVNYPGEEDRVSLETPLADQVEMRLMPKLRGVEVEEKGDVFDRLADHVEGRFRDEALASAIRTSVDAAREGTGQFAWLGVER